MLCAIALLPSMRGKKSEGLNRHMLSAFAPLPSLWGKGSGDGG